MIDPFGRSITYLRVSVTDRCDLRCLYCLGGKPSFVPKAEVLSLEELESLCRTFVSLGVTKIRITGGEPLVRRGVMSLFRGLGELMAVGPLEEVAVTTNGTHLAERAAALVAAGVRRVNVSLDSLDGDNFTAITKGGDLSQVLAGIAAAQKAGLEVKVNAVALKGLNEDQWVPLVAWCGERGMDITFIETMPLGDQNGGLYVPLDHVRERLVETFTFTDSDYSTGGPASFADCAETGHRVGFITPLSHDFCATCNRVRLTCTGKLYLCLGREESLDLRQVLRSGGDVKAAIEQALSHKPEGHRFTDPNSPQPPRRMNLTGG